MTMGDPQLCERCNRYPIPSPMGRYMSCGCFPLLAEAHTQIRKYFPNSESYVKIDPDDEHRMLVAISAELEPDEAFKMLQDFDNKWWLDNLDRAQGRVSIYLELH